MFLPRQELQLQQYMNIKQPLLMGYRDESIVKKKSEELKPTTIVLTYLVVW
jgi:hypothetical protein